MIAVLVAGSLLGTALADNTQPTLEDDREGFVVANTIFVLFHELGHGLIHAFDLPVLGEQMRDGRPIGALIAVDIPVSRQKTDDDLGRRLEEHLRQRQILNKVLSVTATVAALPPGMDVSIQD